MPNFSFLKTNPDRTRLEELVAESRRLLEAFVTDRTKESHS
jgi:hypothetical protein